MQIPPTAAGRNGDDSVNSRDRLTPVRIVLASGSPTRQTLLANAGVPFAVRVAPVDERAIAAPLIEAGASPADIATALADAKALVVSAAEPEALVIGADQTLDRDGILGTKPAGMAEARQQLAGLAGRSHFLHAAVAVARAGAVTWRHRDSARLTMRALGPAAIDRYLARVGDNVLKSVGVYQIEGEGIGLFEAIEGDYFTILGLPLLPLLLYLRSQGAIE